MSITNGATYKAAYRKPEWALFEDATIEEPYLWVIRPYDEVENEAGVCINFKAGKRDIEITITLTSLLLMAKAVVDQEGHELFYGVDTTEKAFGKSAQTPPYSEGHGVFE